MVRTMGSVRRSRLKNVYGVSELGVTKAVSAGVKTRAKLSGALNGPLYWGFFFVDGKGVHREIRLDHWVAIHISLLGHSLSLFRGCHCCAHPTSRAALNRVRVALP